jgi:hypothetical protein
MDLDFTVDKYKQLCQAMLNYEILTLKEYLLREDLPDKYIILRHDVDRKPRNALVIVAIEKEFGIRATYYFRMGRGTFKPEIIRKIASMGHEVGYHYEALDKARGDCQKAIKIFQDELEEFKKIADVKTICMHGNPLTKWDNRHLWQRYDFRHYGILGEAYLSLGNKVYYLTDTSRSWNSKNRVKDRLYEELQINVKTTDELIRLVGAGSLTRIYILIHPERWSRRSLEWLGSYLTDHTKNIGKRVAYRLAGYKG